MNPLSQHPDTLRPSFLIDCDHPAVREFAQEQGRGKTHLQRAVSLFYAVRDGIRYDPYRIDLSPEGMRASTALATGYGWCVTKATLLAAACRAAGIPARLGFADVLNHLSTERLRQTMKTDVFAWHGYTDIWLDGAWRKATPAFNLALCEKFGLLPLEFDGIHDSIYHAFDRAGRKHMEYVKQRGSFNDVPLADIVATFRDLYSEASPAAQPLRSLSEADFLADVAVEIKAG